MPFREDRRDSKQREKDRTGLENQLRRLNDPVGSHRYQRTLFEKIRSSRGHDGPSFEFDRIDRGQDFLVAVSGEILVRTADQVAAAGVLQPKGFSSALPVAVLEGRVIRFSKPGATAVEANNLVRILQGMGVRATVNYVVPLGYVAKGEGGFENTTVEPSYTGPGETDGGGVRVAVVDTGVAPQDRADGWLQNLHLDTADTDPLYQRNHGDLLDFAAGHGTFVAGVIQQVAPQAQVRSYRAVDSDGIGSELDIAAAIIRAGDAGASLINLSLGTETEGDQPPVGLEAALEILATRHPETLVVAAAGNSGSTARCWPAAFPTVVGVASLTAALDGSAWSNHGDWVRCSTVGEGVVSTYVVGQEDPEVDKEGPDTFVGPSPWALGTGTSFAAPQITGAIAQIMSTDPSITAAAALEQLLGQPAARAVPGYGIGVPVLPGT